MTFKDLFSTQSADYARFRPRYPQALFSWLASVAPGRARAVDVATGNGQAALALAEEFAEVVAVDASAAQLAEAPARSNVVYRVGQAESTGVADASADVLTAAQAFHWFRQDAFFAEAARVLRPGGVLAFRAHGHGSPVFTSPRVARHLHRHPHRLHRRKLPGFAVHHRPQDRRYFLWRRRFQRVE
jgi:ubiquinone/menaquinone biosynthesis C-methylase UbiE